MASPSGPHSQNLSLRQRQILGFLHSFCSEFDLEELHDFFCKREKQDVIDISAECRYTSISLSPDQRSSLNSTISSIFSSRDSCASIESYISSSPMPNGPVDRLQANQDNRAHATVSQPQGLQDIYHNSPAGTSPYSRCETLRQPASFFCLTCAKCYNNQHELDRHRREKCESQGTWDCLHCPPAARKSHDRRSHLVEHYKGKHSHEDFLDIESSFRKHPPKRAWGCPCCISCFDAIDKWHEHENTHRDAILWSGHAGNVKVENWTFNNLISSPISGFWNLSRAGERYDWTQCDWTSKHDFGKAVQFALERHVLPVEVTRYPEYKARNLAENLMAYAYCLGRHGTPFMDVALAQSNVSNNVAFRDLYTQPSLHSISIPMNYLPAEQSKLLPPTVDVHWPNQTIPVDGRGNTIVGPSSRPPHVSSSTASRVEMSERNSQNLNKFYPFAISTNAEQVPLVQSTFPDAPQSQFSLAQERPTQRGRSRQSSQSSEIYEPPKRTKLSRSRTTSRHELSSRVRDNDDMAMLSTNVPPLPSFTDREAAIRKATRSGIIASTTSSSNLPYEAPWPQDHLNLRQTTPIEDGSFYESQPTNLSSSQTRLPLRTSHTPISDTNDQTGEPALIDPNELDFSQYLNSDAISLTVARFSVESDASADRRRTGFDRGLTGSWKRCA